MKKSILLRASSAPIALGLALGYAPAFAQDVEPTGVVDDTETVGQPIVVTGSRIATTTISTAPVQVLGAEAIEESGVTNVQAVLLDNPVFGTPTISRTNSSFSSATSGIATVDLRNLGTDRTLVLVNGRRFVAGIPGSATVDLNSIPTPLIERVDILTSGAGSAIYGSDAVAGVVNFIMKDDFEGVSIGGLVGLTEAGDDVRYQGDVLVGGNFGDGRGNATVFFGYTNEGGAYKRKRRTEVGDSFLDSNRLPVDGKLVPNSRNVPTFSSYAPQGTYFTDNLTFTYDRNGLGALRPCNSVNGGTAPATCGAFAGQQIGPDGFNRSFYRLLATPLERFLINGMATYEITDGINAFLEASFATINAKSNIEPFASDSSDAYDTGQYPIETFDPITGDIIRNPFVPDAIYNDASDNDGDGLRDIFFSKRLVDFGPRRSDARRQTFRIVGGFEGDITENWQFDTHFNYGQTTTAQTGSGQYNTINFREGAKIIPDGDGGFQCADPNAVAAGCVPVNIFGLNSFSPEAIAYLRAPQAYNAIVKQTVVGANISGTPFSISPNAPVGVVVGAEYRRESSDEAWDALQQQGLNASNAFPPTSGSFDVREIYGEARVPLISEGPIYDLTVVGAARLSDYSTVGQTFSWNAGAEFAPIEDVRFRGMYAVTVRAPNISELFDGLNQTFPTVSDPCEGVKASDTSALATNCKAATGVNANIAANGGTFTVNLADQQGVTGFNGGNPNLQEEKGKTYTFGVTVNPRSIDALRNLTLSVDYFNIKIEDAIVTTPRAYILDQCYNNGVDAFCAFVKRLPAAAGPRNAGALDEVNTGPSNSGGFKTAGVDVVLNYRNGFDIGSQPIDTSLTVRYTHLLKSWSQPLPEEEIDRFDGEIGASKNRWTANLGLGLDDVKLSFTGTYIGEAYIDDAVTGVLAGEDDDYRFHPEFYLDTQVRFFAADNMEFFIGVDNVFDNVPIYSAGISGAADTGMDADGGTYDPLGRRYYTGARLRF